MMGPARRAVKHDLGGHGRACTWLPCPFMGSVHGVRVLGTDGIWISILRREAPAIFFACVIISFKDSDPLKELSRTRKTTNGARSLGRRS
jgi:hypothetical protein